MRIAGLPLTLALTLPPLQPVSLVFLLAGAVFLALAGLLLYIDFNNRLHRAFALFLTLRAMLNLLTPFNTTQETFWFWIATYQYFALALPFVTLHLVVVQLMVGRPATKLGWLAPALLGAGVVVEGLYLMDHRLMASLGSPGGPLTPLVGLVVSGYLIAANVFLAAFARRSGPERPSFLILAVGFALLPLDYIVHRWLRGIGSFEAPIEWVLMAILLLQVALVVVRPGPRRAATRRWAVLLAAAIASGAGHAFLDPNGTGLAVVADGAWTLAMGVLATYALLRHQLFDIDLRVKGTVKQGTIVAAFVGVYIVAAQGTQAVFGSAAPYIGIGVAGLLALFIAPLQRMADRVANAAMPAVSDSPSYLSVRKLEVYRAALEQGLAVGDAGVSAPRLAALRAELGLTHRDHAILLHAMRLEPDASAVPELAEGDCVLGKYRVERLLGEGAHGRTYLARDEDGGRQVVVKALRPDRGADPSLLREARAMAAVRHPHVVEFIEVEERRGQILIVMEHVDGGSLRARLDAGPLDAQGFREAAQSLLAGLDAVHAAGVVHRDIKPSNVLLTRAGGAKLADFGVAHVPGAETTAGPRDTGTALGTIRYMSPEQAKGRRVTARSDLFSAAATLYEAYTGAPYLPSKPRESPVELQMRAASAGAFRRPVQGPPKLRAWFAKALDPAPEKRFASAQAMATALERAFDE